MATNVFPGVVRQDDARRWNFADYALSMAVVTTNNQLVFECADRHLSYGDRIYELGVQNPVGVSR